MQGEFLSGIYIARRALLIAKDTQTASSPSHASVSHARGLLCRDAGVAWRGRVYMAPKNWSAILPASQPTQQSTVDRGWVVTDCMFSSKEESWNRLFQEKLEKKSAGCKYVLLLYLNSRTPVGL